MNYNSNYEELVSKYLEGEMSDIERLDFENQLVNNDALKEEYQFQKDVLQGVQNVRKAELKARLNNVSVPANYIYQYVGVKTAALVAITVLIGFGAYYFLNDSGIQSSSEVDLTKDQIVGIEEKSIPETPKPELEANKESSDGVENQAEEFTASPEVSKDKNEEQELASSSQPEEIPKPNVVSPDVEEEFNEQEFENEEDPLENIGGVDAMNKAESGKVDVETIPDDNKEFHYSFYNEKLFLYGSFDEMPYEIIEFNVEERKLYFLFYDSTYYRLDDNQSKVVPLKELSDEKLINQLDAIRSK